MPGVTLAVVLVDDLHRRSGCPASGGQEQIRPINEGTLVVGGREVHEVRQLRHTEGLDEVAAEGVDRPSQRRLGDRGRPVEDRADVRVRPRDDLLVFEQRVDYRGDQHHEADALLGQDTSDLGDIELRHHEHRRAAGDGVEAGQCAGRVVHRRDEQRSLPWVEREREPPLHQGHEVACLWVMATPFGRPVVPLVYMR